MNWTAKIAIILLCLSLCGAGTLATSTAHGKTEPRKTNAIPVKHRGVVRQVWIQV